MNKLVNLGQVRRETKGSITNGVSNDGGKLLGYTVKESRPCTDTPILNVYTLASKAIPDGEKFCAT